MTEPEIRAIAKLELKPGDTLVVFLPRDQTNGERTQRIMDAHSSLFPPSITLLIVPDDVRLEVLRRETLP